MGTLNVTWPPKLDATLQEILNEQRLAEARPNERAHRDPEQSMSKPHAAQKLLKQYITVGDM